MCWTYVHLTLYLRRQDSLEQYKRVEEIQVLFPDDTISRLLYSLLIGILWIFLKGYPNLAEREGWQHTT
jgi:hypothetical protein